MSNREKALTILFILPVLGTLIWGGWPQKIIERTFSYNEDVGMIPLQSCLLSSGITSGDWKISYPESLEYKETSDFVLNYYPPSQSSAARDPMKDCQMLFMTRMEVNGANVEPGEIIYTPFDRNKNVRNTWELTATGGKIIGKLWISTLTNAGGDEETQVNLFVIPLEIRVITILGLTPGLIRIMIASISLPAVLLILIRCKLKPE